jgi:hypothetical protein
MGSTTVFACCSQHPEKVFLAGADLNGISAMSVNAAVSANGSEVGSGNVFVPPVTTH